MGPQGLGALLLAPDFARALDPYVTGGTGSASDSEEHPGYMPDKFEPGTQNLPGIYGWEAALAYLAEIGVETVRATMWPSAAGSWKDFRPFPAWH